MEEQRVLLVFYGERRNNTLDVTHGFYVGSKFNVARVVSTDCHVEASARRPRAKKTFRNTTTNTQVRIVVVRLANPRSVPAASTPRARCHSIPMRWYHRRERQPRDYRPSSATSSSSYTSRRKNGLTSTSGATNGRPDTETRYENLASAQLIEDDVNERLLLLVTKMPSKFSIRRYPPVSDPFGLRSDVRMGDETAEGGTGDERSTTPRPQLIVVRH